MELRLHSPVGAEEIVYQWPLPSFLAEDDSDRGFEILDTIRLVCEDFPRLRVNLGDEKLKEYDSTSYSSLRDLCNYFNRVVDNMIFVNKRVTEKPVISETPSRGLLEHILQQVYNLTVKEPDRLNQYEPFSPEVYGETSFSLVCQMIDQISLSQNDTFIDLGSGVGQVVLQMAALTPCKMCLGIEKADVPSEYAENMSKTFRKWMAWYGKTYGDYKIIKGDFLKDEHREKIINSSLIFVNNFAFGPSVDHNLKQIFADLKDGARIVSSKSFCPLNFRITERTLSDIGTIMHVSEMHPIKEAVSWTFKPVSYYLHVIDRTKLERYFQKLKQSNRVQVKRGAASNGNNTGGSSESREGSVESYEKKQPVQPKQTRPQRTQPPKKSRSWSSEDEESNDTPHVYTRRAWSEFIKSKLKSQSNDEIEDSENNSENGQRPNRKVPRRNERKRRSSPQYKPRARARKANKRQKPSLNGLNFSQNDTFNNSANSDNRFSPVSGSINDDSLSSSNLEFNSTSQDNRPVPPQLQQLLNTYKTQYLDMIDQMNTQNFRKEVEKQIVVEQHKKVHLLTKINHLENSIKNLVGEGKTLLESRMKEIGIEASSIPDLLEFTKLHIVKHKKLQIQSAKLVTEIKVLEEEQKRLIRTRQAEMVRTGIEKALSTPVVFNSSMPYKNLPTKSIPHR